LRQKNKIALGIKNGTVNADGTVRKPFTAEEYASKKGERDGIARLLTNNKLTLNQRAVLQQKLDQADYELAEGVTGKKGLTADMKNAKVKNSGGTSNQPVSQVSPTGVQGYGKHGTDYSDTAALKTGATNGWTGTFTDKNGKTRYWMYDFKTGKKTKGPSGKGYSKERARQMVDIYTKKGY